MFRAGTSKATYLLNTQRQIQYHQPQRTIHESTHYTNNQRQPLLGTASEGHCQSPGGDTRLWTVDLSGRVVSQAGYSGRGTDPAWSPLLDEQPANLGGGGPDGCPT